MKNKFTAGILAFLFGSFGTHKFYLGKSGAGFARLILFLFFFRSGIGMGSMVVIGLSLYAIIEGILFFLMDAQEFNKKYNKSSIKPSTTYRPKKSRRINHIQTSAWKKEGMQKFKEFDFDAAIVLFNKVLDADPNSVPTHFNIACTYSLIEDTKKALQHLDEAVRLGFKDFEKIRQHDAFAYLRVQPEYQIFEKNNFRLLNQKQDKNSDLPPLLHIPNEDLLSDMPTNRSLLSKLKELKIEF